MNKQNILSVENLRVVFHTNEGNISAVNDVSFNLKRGELLGIVGESGSGKSVSMLSLLRLLPKSATITSGQAIFNGNDLLQLDKNSLMKIRGGEIGFIFQDPMTSLNPTFTIGFQLAEPLRLHEKLSKTAACNKAIHLLELVGITNASQRLSNYPHEFSGGQRQRIMIAMALACNPKILIADEATTALDVTVQAQIIELIKKLRKQFDMAIIWITHDLGVVAGIADSVAVMYGGQIVEYSDVNSLYETPRHPYTKALLATLPKIGGSLSTSQQKKESGKRARLKSIAGQAPHLKSFPNHCPFSPRCEHSFSKCETANPPLLNYENHNVACWQYQQGK